MNVTKYLKPLREGTGYGPHTSVWMMLSSSVFRSDFCGKGALDIFPLAHVLHFS